MTKKKMNELVLQACQEHGASEELTKVLNELTAPKVGGAADVNDYTVFNEDGSVAYIFCNIHKKWEPVEDEEGTPLFKEDAKSKNGYFRDCNVGIKSFREADKALKASKSAIMQDVLDEVITGAEAKDQLSALGDTRSNIPAREDGLGTEDKPE